VVPANRGSGDIDKLQRSCFDSLTDAAVWRDDSQVVDVAARKRWADEDNPPGADIVVSVWTMP
jgi:Holliday junction resolvase RusA-like endonuclease